ncbi:UDP-3-O-(3-hydroxymyristoyl)glucosamine N-acyltransferase [Aestuariibius insulae]|uniref:UDP-3-O-(3-hydroxymyristoyl)glucosamine N-acyltransferase n=1 Tax=Aestuariibius insulae TaxID=2058287 RepID=UPI00345EE916
MSFSVKDIAAALEAEAFGAVSLSVDGVAEPASARPADLALALAPAYGADLERGGARAAVLWPGADWQALGLEAAIIAPRGRLAMARLTQLMDVGPKPGIHPSAVIDPSAEVTEDASIGPHVSIGPGSVIGAGAQIAAGVRIGRNVRIGARFVAQSNVTIGGDGFSFVTAEPSGAELARETLGETEITPPEDPTWHRIHSLGGVEIGDDVEIGANSCIDAGTIRATRIGRGTKIDNLVQVGHNCIVGEDCLLCGQVGIAGSVVIGDRSVLAGRVGVSDNLLIGEDVVVGVASVVMSNVPKGRIMLGYPATRMATNLSIYKALRRLPRLLTDVTALKKAVSKPGESD